MKLLKANVQYGTGMRSTRCGLCKHFEPPRACAKVEGEISSDAWCKLFARKPAKS